MARGRVREPRGGGGVPGGPRAAIPPAPLGFLASHGYPLEPPWTPWKSSKLSCMACNTDRFLALALPRGNPNFVPDLDNGVCICVYVYMFFDRSCGSASFLGSEGTPVGGMTVKARLFARGVFLRAFEGCTAAEVIDWAHTWGDWDEIRISSRQGNSKSLSVTRFDVPVGQPR